jgi:uncharacterized phage protein (predicted DNA packaging)
MDDEPVTLDQVKDHLRLGRSVATQDDFLRLLIPAARRAVENDIGKSLATFTPEALVDDMRVIQQAMLLIIGHWYWNRETASEKSLKEVPNAVGWLLGPLKRMVA